MIDDRRYPPAQWRGDGRTYGPLPDSHPDHVVRLVLHTTETTVVPGYDRGANAPHWTYDAPRRRWVQHASTSRRVGTLISSASTGTPGNEISLQVELVAFSDRSLANRHGGLWVGDFTDAHYQDLGDHAAWCRRELGIDMDAAYGPGLNFTSFGYGTHADTRLARRAWMDFRGITAHGAVPGNSHWDTGALDLHRILALSKGVELTSEPLERWRNLYNQATPTVYNSVVEHVQRYLIGEGKLPAVFSNWGMRDAATDAALQAWKAEQFDNPDAGPHMGTATWEAIQTDMYSDTVAPPPNVPSARELRLEAAIDDIQDIVDPL